MRVDLAVLGIALMFMGLYGIVESPELKDICRHFVGVCGGVLIGHSLTDRRSANG